MPQCTFHSIPGKPGSQSQEAQRQRWSGGAPTFPCLGASSICWRSVNNSQMFLRPSRQLKSEPSSLSKSEKCLSHEWITCASSSAYRVARFTSLAGTARLLEQNYEAACHMLSCGLKVLAKSCHHCQPASLGSLSPHPTPSVLLNKRKTSPNQTPPCQLNVTWAFFVMIMLWWVYGSYLYISLYLYFSCCFLFGNFPGSYGRKVVHKL